MLLLLKTVKNIHNQGFAKFKLLILVWGSCKMLEFFIFLISRVSRISYIMAVEWVEWKSKNKSTIILNLHCFNRTDFLKPSGGKQYELSSASYGLVEYLDSSLISVRCLQPKRRPFKINNSFYFRFSWCNVIIMGIPMFYHWLVKKYPSVMCDLNLEEVSNKHEGYFVYK